MVKKESSPSGSSPQWFRPILFGPAMKVAALVIAIFLVCRGFLPHKVPIERHIVGGDAANLVRNPTAEFLMMKSGEIGLSAPITVELRKTEQAKAHALVPVEIETKRASEQFAQFMQRYQSGAVSMAQIQDAARPLSAASQANRLVEKHFDDAAWYLLTPPQQEKAQHLWDLACAQGKRMHSTHKQVARLAGGR